MYWGLWVRGNKILKFHMGSFSICWSELEIWVRNLRLGLDRREQRDGGKGLVLKLSHCVEQIINLNRVDGGRAAIAEGGRRWERKSFVYILAQSQHTVYVIFLHGALRYISVEGHALLADNRAVRYKLNHVPSRFLYRFDFVTFRRLLYP